MQNPDIYLHHNISVPQMGTQGRGPYSRSRGHFNNKAIILDRNTDTDINSPTVELGGNVEVPLNIVKKCHMYTENKDGTILDARKLGVSSDFCYIKMEQVPARIYKISHCLVRNVRASVSQREVIRGQIRQLLLKVHKFARHHGHILFLEFMGKIGFHPAFINKGVYILDTIVPTQENGVLLDKLRHTIFTEKISKHSRK